jgi:tRNA dimethylallyltransferase
MIDVVDPDEDYSVAEYVDEAAEVITAINARGRRPFVVGGTGLYIRALTRGIFSGPDKDEELRRELMEVSEKKGREVLFEELKRVDPVSAARIHPNNTHRLIRALEVYRLTGRPISELQAEHDFKDAPYDVLYIAVGTDRGELRELIDTRVDKMIELGLVDEVRALIKKGYSPELKSMRSLGYKEIAAHINGMSSLDEAIEELKLNTYRYAKRQFTWFRNDGMYKWFDKDEKTDIIASVKEFLNR